MNENSIQKCTWKLTDQFSDVSTWKDMTIDKWADGFFRHQNINHPITLQRDCGWVVHLEIHRCIYVQTPWNTPAWASKTFVQHGKKVESLFGEYCGFFFVEQDWAIAKRWGKKSGHAWRVMMEEGRAVGTTRGKGRLAPTAVAEGMWSWGRIDRFGLGDCSREV